MTNQNVLLEQVMASGSYYAAMSLRDGVPKQQVLHSIAEFNAFIDVCNANKVDAYFGLSTFTQGWYTAPSGKKHFRTKTNAARQKSLWLDLDAGEGKPYADQDAAAVAVNAFASTIGVPRPTLVCSGGGVHAYWPLQEEVESAVWTTMAHGLHTLCVQHGLAADPARTRDVASVLRLPGSYNFKQPTPRPVYIMQLGHATDVGVFWDKLSGVGAPAVGTSSLHALDMSALAPYQGPQIAMLPQEDMEVPKAALVITGCAQVRDQLNAPEPIWRGMISVVLKCADGEQHVHALSSVDPRYSAEDTNQKIASVVEAGIGPYLCDTFDSLRPGVCSACPKRGHIKSPVALGVAYAEPTPVVITAEVEGRVESFAPPPFIGDAARRYEISAAGCTMISRKANEAGEWVPRRELIHNYPIYPVHILYHRDDNNAKTYSVMWRLHREGGFDDVLIPAKLMDSQTLHMFIADRTLITIADEFSKKVREFMKCYLQNARTRVQTSEIRHNLGWDKETVSFVLGNRLYKGGNSVDIITEGEAKHFSTLTNPIGVLDAWKEAAEVYNRNGMQWAQTVVCTAFASPLMSLGSMEKAALISISGDKGHGKTAAQQVALTVYGSPLMLMVPTDTPVSRIHKLGIANSIAVAMDEMTDITPAQASEFAYTIPAGVGKSRMAQGGTGLLENNTRWSTLPTISMNGSILDTLAQHSSDATPQMSRVLEITSVDPQALYTEVEMDHNKHVLSAIATNYGHAGDAYVRFITKHRDAITTLIMEYEGRFARRTGLTNVERFFPYMATRLMVGATIARSLGLINYDLAGLEVYLMEQAQRMKRRISSFVQDPSSWLGEFRAEHMANIQQVTTAVRPRRKADGSKWADDTTQGHLNDIGYVVYAPQHKGIVGRYVIDADELYLQRSVVGQWCRTNRITIQAFEAELGRQGILFATGAKRQKRDIGVGTFARGTSVDVLCIKGAGHVAWPEEPTAPSGGDDEV